MPKAHHTGVKCPHIVDDYCPHLISFPCWAEPKYDGHRCLITADPLADQAFARTRRGHDVTSHLSPILRSIRAAIRRAGISSPIVLDGELCHLRGPNEVTSICRSHSHLRDKFLIYVAFDLPLSPGPYTERRTALVRLLGRCSGQQVSVAQSIEIRSMTTLRRHYRQALNDGHEGLVVKEPASRYDQPGAWLRLKPGIAPW